MPHQKTPNPVGAGPVAGALLHRRIHGSASTFSISLRFSAKRALLGWRYMQGIYVPTTLPPLMCEPELQL